MSNVGKIYGIPQVSLLEPLPEVVCTLPHKLAESIRHTLCGVEVEIEEAYWKDMEGQCKVQKFWNVTEDGSLRNDGLEFVSRLGLAVGHIHEALSLLYNVLEDQRSERKRAWSFSERCSIHVHLNVMDFSEKQIENLLVLYTLYEDQLFSYCAENRRQGIFSIPLRNSTSAQILRDGDKSIWAIAAKFYKYGALNMEAIQKYGTVEFRHLEGTKSFDKVYTWVLLLSLLHSYARLVDNVDLKRRVYKLKSNSAYEAFTEDVFSTLAPCIKKLTNPLVMDMAVSDSKLFFTEE